MSGKHMLTTSCGLPLFDPDRDMNRWIVTIPHVDSRRDLNTGWFLRSVV